MTTASTSTSGVTPQDGRGVGLPASGAPPIATIDPIKLLKRFKWALAAAVGVGAVLGLVVHFVLLQVYPVFVASVLFECHPPQSDIGDRRDTGLPVETEMERFMQTQVRFMTADQVLRRVAENPQLPREAPKWIKRFTQKGGVNRAEVLEELRDEVQARIIPQTKLIELRMSWRDKVDVTSIVRLSKESFMAVLHLGSQSDNSTQAQSITQAITDANTEISGLSARRKRLMDDNQIDSVEQRNYDLTQRLQLANEEWIKTQMDLTELLTRQETLQVELQKPAIDFPDALREEVEQDRLMLGSKEMVNRLEAERSALLIQFTPEHREVKRLATMIEGAKRAQVDMREQLLRQRFEGLLGEFDQRIRAAQGQQKQLEGDRVDLSARMIKLASIQSELNDIDQQIRGQIDSKSTYERDLSNLRAVIRLPTSDRVTVWQGEMIPDRPAFPQLKFLIPMGAIFSLLGVAGFVIVRELLDQRVKGPSDVAMIPRTRVLGWIPDAAEDPSGTGAVETAFRDRARGVVAESYRQARAVIAKRITSHGHKAIVVLGGMPGSGATSVVCNLAFAFAASDLRVLVVDANFRRPGLHRVFGLPEAPGLADALASGQNIQGLVQKSSDGRLDVLTAGSKEGRVFERLSSESMSAALAQARAAYDVVLLDAPPAVVSGDGLSLANRCDASILVVRALAEKRGMVARIRNDLSDTRSEFLGVLVNGVRSSAGGYLRGNIRATHEYQSDRA